MSTLRIFPKTYLLDIYLSLSSSTNFIYWNSDPLFLAKSDIRNIINLILLLRNLNFNLTNQWKCFHTENWFLMFPPWNDQDIMLPCFINLSIHHKWPMINVLKTVALINSYKWIWHKNTQSPKFLTAYTNIYYYLKITY